MIAHVLPVLLLASLLGACNGSPGTRTKPRPVAGRWTMDLDLNGRSMPFHVELIGVDSAGLQLQVINGDEVILVDDLERRRDSLFVRMPLFDSEFKGIIRTDSLIEGYWYNYLKGPDYRIPFVARAGNRPPTKAATSTLGGHWEVHFNPSSRDGYNAIGIFEQEPDGRATGTFVTETGDYRYLEGRVHGDSLQLSGFDGSHAFLFVAGLRGDSLHGTFLSGTHWEEPWVAVRNPQYTLRDPDSLTFLREGHDMMDLRFPDLHGTLVSPSDPRYKGKPLVIQIMGSWCPNCVDETLLLNELYAEHHSAGLEVMAVAFEKYDDAARAVAGLERFRDALNVPYPILYAGKASKEEAAAKLPFLSHVMSYPTCIIVDREGKVRRIRTGIYGPSTGSHYEQYKLSLSAFLVKLLNEEPSLAQGKP
jgi:thiol-disulfide isomerase/thioredoxin